MKDFVDLLARQAGAAGVRVDAELDAALARLDLMLEGLCADLEVEYHGPYVGVEKLEAHRMVVRPHEWRIHCRAWSLKLCSAAAEADFRAEWAIQGAGRLRKALVVKALPQFFSGFAAAVTAAGKGGTPSGRRILQLAQRFGETSCP